MKLVEVSGALKIDSRESVSNVSSFCSALGPSGTTGAGEASGNAAKE